MKKLLFLFAFLSVTFLSGAQDYYQLPGGAAMHRDFLQIPATLFGFCLLVFFILSILRGILDYRLKYKMIEKGVPDEIVKQFLQPNIKDVRNQAIKWCLLLAGIGLGLAIIGFARPYGIHSVAIIAFCLSGSFLGYFFFIKRHSH